ncbi:Vsp/OspC family lipoprotein (plasmid) [Borrelia miyamotoi]|uniref:Vsp/OspC family lipoprotein n=2 Tax=Borrelia miyamotoi TaxID=47466 RepID=A0AAQ3CMZ1_9SPIR|nr:Vsp/OspC family lipoprotein [Borrelia miyamotoi]ATQ15605.2 Vsp/OspC family lipoprotein [Borrelia miyamotoi]ATQ16727.2 Vsp/OspC family lipoprotein [Borrelia miyamotoi]ATQ17717.2 Vsp/OspC family lipoprotein [Borrelia miyamotoi]ATQ17875.2 Vsp/OspC family lipoprotein [Borrelia miyamotoi]ATQ20349.2 Vsp/OspC family lipoprotein [Borrelia miyamotoi]
MKKRKTLSAIIMTLFLIINIVMISCGSGGPAPKEGQAAKADGTVIDLAKISKKIKDAVEFAASVKEVETLVKSVDELAKAIGKKVEAGGTLGDDGGQNGSLISGAYSVVLSADAKLGQLENKEGISTELKAKVTAAKAASKKFLDTVKGANTDLGKKDASDENAKKALLKSDAAGDKGAKDLIALNTAIDELLKATEASIEAVIAELTTLG